MATKIGVLKAGQEIGRPAYHVSKAEADQRVLAGVAERLSHVLIRMLSTYDQAVETTRKLLDIRRMKLPSYEIPGISVRGPFTERSGYGRTRIIAANMIAAGR